MSLAIFSFIFVMWILIIVGGGLMVLFVGPLSFSGYGDLDPLINSGFCKEVLQQLPMEFAVEAQKLVGISLEGSVG